MTYLVEDVIGAVVFAGCLMMAIVPASVTKLTIVSVVLHYLLLRDLESCWVSHAVGVLENSLGILASERGVAVISSYWRPHLSEDTHILSLL